jgi:short-subunit dehydrogenase
MKNFSGELIWITGASSGIGAALAVQLASLGAKVIISARNAEKLQALADGFNGAGRILPLPLDVTDPVAVAAAVNTLQTDHGRIDRVILNAGTYIPDSVVGFTAKSVKTQLDLNVLGCALMLEQLLPLMRGQGGGAIAIVASVAGYRGLPYAAGYGASKAALINMAESLQPECKQLGIKLQLICPGFVKTPLTDRNDFAMPFIISAEDAARRIAQGLSSDRFEIVFPKRMKIAMKILRLLPNGLFLRLSQGVLRK